MIGLAGMVFGVAGLQLHSDLLAIMSLQFVAIGFGMLLVKGLGSNDYKNDERHRAVEIGNDPEHEPQESSTGPSQAGHPR